MADLTDVAGMHLWAWVGEDDGPTQDGELGLKQGLTPAGCIPLVACNEGKMTQPYIRQQMHALVKQTGKTRYLVRFKAEAIEEILLP